MQLKQLKIQNKRLTESLRVEIKAKNRLVEKLNTTKIARDKFYDRWIQDHKKAYRYRLIGMISFIINLGLLVLLYLI